MSFIEGIEDIPKHIEAWVKGEAALHPELQAAVAMVPKLLANLAAEIKANGITVVKAAGVALAQEAEGALTGATSKGAAGNAAIATIKTAGTTLLDDTLHTLTTEALTGLATVETALAPTPAATPAA